MLPRITRSLIREFDDLVLLCRHHHRLVNESGFVCKRSQDGEDWFEDNEITAVTPAAKWYSGERMDWDHAVSSMFTYPQE